MLDYIRPWRQSASKESVKADWSAMAVSSAAEKAGNSNHSSKHNLPNARLHKAIEAESLKRISQG